LEERRGELRQGDKQLLVYALFQTPHRSEVPVLAPLLRERSRETRRMAAVALAEIKATEAREALEEAARSLSWLRGMQARRALRSLRYVSGE
jgi:HEAT repeat protein